MVWAQHETKDTAFGELFCGAGLHLEMSVGQEGSRLPLSQAVLLKCLDHLPECAVSPQAETLSVGALCQTLCPWGMGEGRTCTRLVFSPAAESPEEKAQLQVAPFCPSASISLQMLT